MKSANNLIGIILSITTLLTSCKDHKAPEENFILDAEGIITASMNAVGSNNNRKSVANIIYIAVCRSPKGAYTTELHSDTTGYSFFKQVYSFDKDSFVQVIHNRGREPSGSPGPVSPETAYTVRSHEFINILLELNLRFHDFKGPDSIMPDRSKGYVVEAKDELGHDCWLNIDSTTLLLKEILFRDPGNEKEMISTKFSSWRTVNGLNLPHHIEFIQGGNTYTFDIRTLKINDPDFKQIK